MREKFILIILLVVFAKIGLSQWRVNTQNLNIRSGAGTNYKILGIIPQGKAVKVIEKESNLRRYKIDEKVYDIPVEDEKDILSLFPEAIKLRTFKIGIDTFDIPLAEVDAFLAENPNAEDKNDWWYISYEGIKGYVLSQHLSRMRVKDYSEINTGNRDYNNGWNKKSYQSGQTPECENVIPQYDFALDNFLKINVGSHTDVVIKLMKKQYGGDICIRIVYIRSNESYHIRNIPEGNYYLKIAYGSDWRQKITNNQCYGKFMKNAHYEIGKEKLNYNIVHLHDRDKVPSFELSLDVITTKGTKQTFNSNNISETEFNK